MKTERGISSEKKLKRGVLKFTTLNRLSQIGTEVYKKQYLTTFDGTKRMSVLGADPSKGGNRARGGDNKKCIKKGEPGVTNGRKRKC